MPAISMIRGPNYSPTTVLTTVLLTGFSYLKKGPEGIWIQGPLRTSYANERSIERFTSTKLSDMHLFYGLTGWGLRILTRHVLDGLYEKNTMNDQEQSGDWNPKAICRTTEGDRKFQEHYKHSIGLDKLIEKVMEGGEEIERIEKKKKEIQ
ncbi:hypothetical protein TNCV_3370031 [Trichonephila clavipes]|nr:hypothetical protein TNCV_3370031 [Trichonephila clavipes]